MASSTCNRCNQSITLCPGSRYLKKDGIIWCRSCVDLHNQLFADNNIDINKRFPYFKEYGYCIFWKYDSEKYGFNLVKNRSNIISEGQCKTCSKKNYIEDKSCWWCGTKDPCLN